MPRSPEQTNLDLDTLYGMSVEQPQMIKEASSQRLKFAENKDRFSRIGFDLFRDNESEFIWKLEKDSESGEEFIIRTASIDPQHPKTKTWSTEVDSKKQSITLIYKGHAIKSFKKADLKFTDDNVEQWRKFILDKIDTDPAFVENVVANMSDQRRKFVAGICPELLK